MVEARQPAPAVRVFADREQAGRAAAGDVAAEVIRRLSTRRGVRMVFAAAPSQREMLAALAVTPGIDWSRVSAFHLDEYLGLPAGDPRRFGQWLRRELFDRLPFRAVHLIEPGHDPQRAAVRYADLLAAAPIDIVCLGIGVNGHLAFNDPPVADLHDPLAVKVVQLDGPCRRQQVDDGCFDSLDSVPRRAITLTIPRLLDADRLYCVAVGAAKRDAVGRALHDEIGTACPATALRLHPQSTLYLDEEAGRDVPYRS